MGHRRAIGIIFGLFLVPPIIGAALFIAAHVIGVRTTVVAGSALLLCWACSVLILSFHGILKNFLGEPFSQKGSPKKFFQDAVEGGLFAGLPRWGVALFGVVSAWTFWLSSMPPYYRDDLIIHLELPKHILRAGVWEAIPFQAASFAPNVLVPLNMVFVNAGIDWAASFLPAAHLLAGALVLAHWVAMEQDHGGWGVWAALALITLPLFFRLATTAYNDPVVMFFSCAGAFYFYRWQAMGILKDGVAGAVALAAGSAVKYNAGLLLVVMLAALLLADMKKFRAWLKVAAAAVGAVLLFCGPWWIASAAAGAAPPAPIPGIHGPLQERMAMCGEAAAYALTAPVRAFFQGTEGNGCRFDGTLNPLLLVFGFAFLPLACPRGCRFLWASVLLYLGFCGVMFSIMSRYLLPVAPILIFVSAFFLADLARRGMKTAAVILAAAFLAVNAAGYARAAQGWDGWPYLLGKEPKAAFLARAVPTYRAGKFMDAHLGKTDTVYFAFMGNQVYYTNVRYMYDPFWDGTMLMKVFSSAPDAASAAAALKAKGITHILYRRDIMQRFIAQNRRETLFAGFASAHARPLYEDGGVTLVALE